MNNPFLRQIQKRDLGLKGHSNIKIVDHGCFSVEIYPEGFSYWSILSANQKLQLKIQFENQFKGSCRG